jgi:acyl dehydratase
VTTAANALPPYRLRAHNAATASENKIHDDEVARRHGFAGGLVPGITVFGYLTRPAVELWGQAWLERGTMAGRFRQPVYEGDDVTVEGALVDGADATVELQAMNGAGDVCAVGTATLPAAPIALPAFTDYPLTPLLAERVPPTPEALAALGDLGTVEAGFHAGRADETLALVGDDLPLYRDLGVAHPTWLLYFANTLLASSVALGPWIHTASDIRNVGMLHDGQRLSARGRVASLSERKGHQLVDLDILMVADGTDPVMHVRHSAIYLLRAP